MEIPIGPVTMDTPLPPGEVVFGAMFGMEELSHLYAYAVEMESANTSIRASQLLGQPLTVHLGLHNDEQRHWGGIVTEFRLVEAFGDGARYAATIRPWFWLLTRTSNSRIFQNKSGCPNPRPRFCELWRPNARARWSRVANETEIRRIA